MKKMMTVLSAAMMMAGVSFAQTTSTTNTSMQTNTDEGIHSGNAWLKIGINGGLPLGDAADAANFTLGVDLSGQYMLTNHFGIGLSTGYNHYFGDMWSDFGTVPANLLLRYYPRSSGIFVGLDGGYTFLTNVTGETGGFNLKPQVGYHNYSWNFYGYYNHIFGSAPMIDIQTVGVAAAYNIRFNKRK